MKRFFLSTIFLATANLAYAQIEVITYNPDLLAQSAKLNNSNNNNNNIQLRNTTNSINNVNNTNKVITTRSGVKIQQPDWSNAQVFSQNAKSNTNVEDIDNNMANNMANNTTNNTTNIDIGDSGEDIQSSMTKAPIANKSNTANTDMIKIALPTDNASLQNSSKNNATNIKVKKIGQVNPEVNSNKMQTISDWNKDTLNSYEKQGKEDLEKKYSNFLNMPNK